jgi:hypothetical protein
MSSILQWKKLSTKSSDKGLPWETASEQEEDFLSKGTKAEKGFVLRGKIKEQKNDYNPEKRMRRKHLRDENDAHRVARSSSCSENKMHIVQCKKAQFTHLLSSQKVMPKDEDHCPIVYDSGKRNGRKEVAALWLAPFRVDDN